MNALLKLAPTSEVECAQPTPLQSYIGRVSGFDDQQKCLIDEQFSATCADGLLVKPNIGDVVTFCVTEGHYYITQIIKRNDVTQDLVIESKSNVRWIAPQMNFTALEDFEITSFNKVSVVGNSCVLSASESMVQNTEHLIQHAGQHSLTVTGLYRVSSKQQILNAEEDVRIDGKRINMG